MRYCDTVAEYEQAKANGTVTDDVLVIVLEDKVIKFKGKTFDLSTVDMSSLASKQELQNLISEIEANEEVHAAAYNDLSARINELAAGGGSGEGQTIIVDSVLSETSENAIMNKVVASELKKKQDTISDLETIRSGAAKGATAIQNVKTINNEAVAGTGNIVVGTGGSAFVKKGVLYSYDYNDYASYANGEATDFIKVGGRVKGRMYFAGSANPRFSIIFLDEDKNILSRYLGDGSVGVQNFDLSSEIPDNAVYFVATNYKEYTNDAYVILDSYQYISDIYDVQEEVKAIPEIKKNIGDHIIETGVVTSSDHFSKGIKCETGKVRVKVSLVNGTLPYEWYIYRYTQGAYNEIALASQVPYGDTVEVDVPEGDDGIWLFINKANSNATIEYEIKSGANRDIALLDREMDELDVKTSDLQGQVNSIKGELGSEVRTSIKNRISLFVDNTPTVEVCKMRVSSDNPASSKFNVYTCTADHASLTVVHKNVPIGTWVEITRDPSKPSLYIYDAGATDGNTDLREYVIEFRTLSSLFEEVENLKNSVTGGWNGKTIVCFGDSLTENKDFDNQKTYSDYIHDITEANVINIGIGGTQFRQRATPAATPPSYKEAYAALDIVNMVKACCEQDFSKQIAAASFLTTDQGDNNEAIVARMQTINWSNVNAVIIFAGTNDWNNGYSNWGTADSTDINSTFGAINEIVRMLLTTYPHLLIYWFTPTVRWMSDSVANRTAETFSDTYMRNNKTLKEFSLEIEELVKKHHLPICDMYNTLGWNMYNFSSYFSDTDGTHPRKGKGTEQIARKMIAFIDANKTF